MFMSLMLAAALTSLPADQKSDQQREIERQDVAYEEMVKGETQEAIAKILASDAYSQGDPAALINLGTAYAAIGDHAKAREALSAAMNSDESYTLQLADGRWIDSRRAAVLAMRRLPDAGAAFATR